MTINKKENHKLLAGIVVGATISFLATSFYNNNKMKIDLSTPKQETGLVIAKANGKEIYNNEVNEKLLQINPQLSFENLKNEEKELLIKEIFAQKLVLKKALKNDSYKTYSPSLQRFAIEETKNNYLKEEAQKQVKEDDIKAKYEEIIKEIEGKKEYLVSHVLTKTKSEINKASYALNSKSFENVAQKFSIDTSNSQNGGKLGYIVEGSTMPEFDSQIKKLKKGKTSRPFKTAIGWHIIKVSEVRDVQPAKFEEVKEAIKTSLVNEKRKDVATKLVEDIKIEIL